MSFKKNFLQVNAAYLYSNQLFINIDEDFWLTNQITFSMFGV
jgi:hypothetical protein